MAPLLFWSNIFVFGSILIHFPSCLDSLEADEDPYKILGVPRSASNADIKKAYKKMARNW